MVKWRVDETFYDDLGISYGDLKIIVAESVKEADHVPLTMADVIAVLKSYRGRRDYMAALRAETQARAETLRSKRLD